jgi:hypothetical protein
MNKKKNETEPEIPKDMQKEKIISMLQHIITLLDEIAKNTFKGH